MPVPVPLHTSKPATSFLSLTAPELNLLPGRLERFRESSNGGHSLLVVFALLLEERRPLFDLVEDLLDVEVEPLCLRLLCLQLFPKSHHLAVDSRHGHS